MGNDAKKKAKKDFDRLALSRVKSRPATKEYRAGYDAIAWKKAPREVKANQRVIQAYLGRPKEKGVRETRGN